MIAGNPKEGRTLLSIVIAILVLIVLGLAVIAGRREKENEPHKTPPLVNSVVSIGW